MAKQKLFSITADDFEFQSFRAGGPGGQKQNKTSSGVRAIHRPSGARAESREHRSQGLNKRAAWKRAVESEEFQRWLAIEIKRRSGRQLLEDQEIERRVQQQIRPINLRIEVKQDDKWVEVSENELE